jgi:hypothetical protein
MPANHEQDISAHFANAAYDLVALAASAGRLTALSLVLSNLPAEFPAAVVQVLHQDEQSLDIGLPVEKLKEPVHAFLAGQADQKEMVLDAVTCRGRRIQARITSTLRLDPDGEPQGVVLLMEEEKC